WYPAGARRAEPVSRCWTPELPRSNARKVCSWYPGPGRVRLPVGTADQGEQHREVPEQGGPGEAKRRPVDVPGHVVGHLLPRPRPVLLRARYVVPGPQDGAHRLEPRLVGDPGRGHPEGAGVAEVGAQRLPGTADQVVVLGGGQVEDGP